MLWLRLALPVLLAGSGIAAGAVAVATDDPAPEGATQVWIDGPRGNIAYAPGPTAVQAHATAISGIDALDLYVDGEKVATDDDLQRTETLALALFEWDAEVGIHDLVVRQVGGEEQESDPRRIAVVEGGMAIPMPTPTEPGQAPTSPSSTSTTGSTSTSTTTTVPGEAPEGESTVPGSTTQPGGSATTRPPGTTTPGTTRPPATTAPPQQSPEVDRAVILGGAVLYERTGCPYTVRVAAEVRNAQTGEIILRGTGFRATMQRSGTSFTLTIPSGFGTGDLGTHSLEATFTGPGGQVGILIGQVTIKPGCPKD